MKEALLFNKQDELIQCSLCSHRCQLKPSQFGICGVRQNVGGVLFTIAYGELTASHCDPIEKKPFYHFLPGTQVFSIATIGCNFKCSFCQNWQISQASKNDNKPEGSKFTPEEIVIKAKQNKCMSIAYTYTEPTIFFEYALDTAKLARKEGLLNTFVTNGYMTEEALKMFSPFLDACNVDLKSFSEKFYQDFCGASLKPVLDSIKRMKEQGIWVEITTLVIPGENDSEKELSEIASFIAEIGKDIPWHLSRFHPDFNLIEKPVTSLEILIRAREIGKRCGLRYVYIGNVSGEEEITFCHNCGKPVIERYGFSIKNLNLKKGICLFCRSPIDGMFL